MKFDNKIDPDKIHVSEINVLISDDEYDKLKSLGGRFEIAQHLRETLNFEKIQLKEFELLQKQTKASFWIDNRSYQNETLEAIILRQYQYKDK